MSSPIRKLAHFTIQQQQDIRAGGVARKHHIPLGDCPLLDEAQASCWRAGWHDADMAAGNRITNFHPIAKQEAA
jgi:hypothetical protein